MHFYYHNTDSENTSSNWVMGYAAEDGSFIHTVDLHEKASQLAVIASLVVDVEAINESIDDLGTRVAKQVHQKYLEALNATGLSLSSVNVSNRKTLEFDIRFQRLLKTIKCD